MLLKYIWGDEITRVEDGYGNRHTLAENQLIFVHPDNDLHQKYSDLFVIVTDFADSIDDAIELEVETYLDAELENLLEAEVQDSWQLRSHV